MALVLGPEVPIRNSPPCCETHAPSARRRLVHGPRTAANSTSDTWRLGRAGDNPKLEKDVGDERLLGGKADTEGSHVIESSSKTARRQGKVGGLQGPHHSPTTMAVEGELPIAQVSESPAKRGWVCGTRPASAAAKSRQKA